MCREYSWIRVQNGLCSVMVKHGCGGEMKTIFGNEVNE
jgi:hypothetical protein